MERLLWIAPWGAQDARKYCVEVGRQGVRGACENVDKLLLAASPRRLLCTYFTTLFAPTDREVTPTPRFHLATHLE